jgi:hypothetical protein
VIVAQEQAGKNFRGRGFFSIRTSAPQAEEERVDLPVNVAGVADNQGRRHWPDDDRAWGARLAAAILLAARSALATSLDRLAH